MTDPLSSDWACKYRGRRRFLGFPDGQIGDGLDDPLEVFWAYGVEVGVGGGVHEVDGVGDAVFDGELDGVEIVAEGPAESERIFLDALQQFLVVGGRVEDVALVRAGGAGRRA